MFIWTIKEIELPLKFVWNISRNKSDIKRNFIVEVKNGSISGTGEIAYNIRYGETRELILSKFDEFLQAATNIEFNGVENLVAFMDKLELPQSLRFGLESSFVHYISILSGKSVAQLMGLNVVSSVRTSFSIPIMEVRDIKNFIDTNKLQRFSTIKLKINDENALDLCKEVLKCVQVPLRVDANEAFKSVELVMKFLESFPEIKRLEFLEQPLHASMHEEALELKKYSKVLLMADESVTKEEISNYYVDRFHGVNIKLMKAGGYLKAVKQLRQAKLLGLKTMLGCMVETSLGISSALNISGGVDFHDLDGSLFLQDDPYKLISEESGKIFYSYIQ